jgi:hypothetical protein
MTGGNKAAEEFFGEITKGHERTEQVFENGALRRKVGDTFVTYRQRSNSDGSPTVEFHQGTMYKEQKIHFIDD